MPGPAPKKHARYGTGKSGWIQLPAEGRKGRTPAWPLDGRAPAGWKELWKKPQAIMWEHNGDQLVVARYLHIRNLVGQPRYADLINAAALSELRQLEDRLGLSPMALKRLQWEITGDPLENMGNGKKPSTGKVVDASERFLNL